MLKKFLAGALLVLTAGCGGPEFSVSYRFVPPPEGKECLKGCEEKYSECRLKCSEEHSRCMERVRREASRIYEKELLAYQKELTAYQKAYDAYQRELLNWNRNYRELYRDYLYFKSKCKKTKDYFACQRKEDLEEALETLSNTKPKPPQKPVKPSLSDVVRELSLSCPTDCGCKEQYDACFTSCGGKIIPERICVKNCN
jgi:hypothetical protein